MFRYSLGTLLVAVFVTAVGCAALMNPTPLWSQIVFTGALVMLLGATVIAAVGGWRPLVVGFAIFGWGYLLLTCGPWGTSVRPHLLTETGLAKLEPRVVDPNTVPTIISGLGAAGITPWTGSSTYLVNQSYNPYPLYVTYPGLPYASGMEGDLYFRQIGHTLAAILFGAVGAVLARWVARKTPAMAARATEDWKARN